MGDLALWLGAILSIPAGIVTGLATPALQRWLESRGQDNALKQRLQAERAEYELERIEAFVREPTEFTQYLVYVGVKISLIGAAIGIFSGVAYFASQIFTAYQADISLRAAQQGDIPETMSQLVLNIPSLLGQLASIVGAVMILRVANTALKTWTRVKHFDRYKGQVEASLKPQ